MVVKTWKVKQKIIRVKCIQELSLSSIDERILSYYDIWNHATLELALKLRGGYGMKFGVEFVDVSNEGGLQRVEWSKKAPKWRCAAPGLCLEGACKNIDCDANNNRVIMPIGYGRFDLMVDTNEHTTKCPMCSKYMEPKSCSFNNCWWKWSGSKWANKDKARFPSYSEWKYADNAAHYFDKHKSGTFRWGSLVFEILHPNEIN
jgi:hypothetical protein